MPLGHQPVLPILKDTWINSKARNNLILQFNYLLDKKSNYFSLNESALEDLIDQLDNLAFVRDVSYWLTLARINELALLCTENYANNGEITLVGDLLFNPRLNLIHVRGQNRPIVKERHTPLTEQFGSVAETYPEVVQWLKTETFLEIKIAALLPYLHQKLEESGCFSKEYINSLNERKIQISELTVFLASAGVTESLALHRWLKNAGPSDRELMESKLCCCNLDRFIELGRQVRVKAKVTEQVPPGIVWMDFHFREGNANWLTNPAFDPLCLTAEYKACAVQVKKA